jgi:gamma-glutamyl:cysteine ligase YbdK (ATP-grasp superfamily)
MYAGSKTGGVRSDFHLVDVTPSPVLSRLERLHDRVMDGAKVLGCVFVFRAVAASDVPAGETQPEMHPFVAGFQAFLASVRTGRHFSDFLQVLTG